MTSNLHGIAARGILFLFIASGILMRFTGLGWGIPRSLPPEATTYRNSYHFDEDNYLWGLTRIDPAHFNFDVRDYHWGTLQFYLVAGGLQAARWCGYLTHPWKQAFLSWDPEDFPAVFIAGRAVSAVAGVLTLLVIYLVGRRIGTTETGLAAAAFLAISPLHVMNSHFLTADVTMVLFLLSAFHFFLATLDGGKTGAHLLSGLMLGLAMSTKYNAACLIPLWVARDLAQHESPWGAKLTGYLALAAGFAVGEPYAVIHPHVFLKTIYEAHVVESEAVKLYLLPWPRLLLEQGRALADYGLQWPLAAAAAAGLVFCSARPSRLKAALLGGSLLTAASLIPARWPMIRYTLPLLVLLLVAAAVAASGRLVREAWRPWIYCALGSLPLFVSWAQVRIMLRDHPANMAAAWVEARVPAGSGIGQIWPELPPLDSRRYDLHVLHGLFPRDRPQPQDWDREYLILDNLPIVPFGAEFREFLAKRYHCVAEFRSDPEAGNWVISERSAPQDWKYTHPWIRIYRRK